MSSPIFYVRKDGMIEFTVMKAKHGFLHVHHNRWEGYPNRNPYNTGGMSQEWEKNAVALLVFSTNESQYQDFLQWLEEE